MQDIKEREFRDSGSIANTEICFEVRATALRPRLHTEGFHYMSTQDLPHREAPLKIWQIQLGVHNSSLQQNSLYTRGKSQQLSPHTRGIRD